MPILIVTLIGIIIILALELRERCVLLRRIRKEIISYREMMDRMQNERFFRRKFMDLGGDFKTPMANAKDSNHA